MENKKNILEICNQFGIGGTEKTLQIFCKYLDKKNTMYLPVEYLLDELES